MRLAPCTVCSSESLLTAAEETTRPGPTLCWPKGACWQSQPPHATKPSPQLIAAARECARGHRSSSLRVASLHPLHPSAADLVAAQLLARRRSMLALPCLGSDESTGSLAPAATRPLVVAEPGGRTAHMRWGNVMDSLPGPAFVNPRLLTPHTPADWPARLLCDGC